MLRFAINSRCKLDRGRQCSPVHNDDAVKKRIPCSGAADVKLRLVTRTPVARCLPSLHVICGAFRLSAFCRANHELGYLKTASPAIYRRQSLGGNPTVPRSYSIRCEGGLPDPILCVSDPVCWANKYLSHSRTRFR